MINFLKLSLNHLDRSCSQFDRARECFCFVYISQRERDIFVHGREKVHNFGFIVVLCNFKHKLSLL